MKRTWLLALALIVAALPAAAAPPQDKVTVGYVITLSQAPYYVALEKGYFAQEGIAIEPASFRGAQDTVAALATGQLDLSMGAIAAGFFNAAHAGLDLRAVAALGIQPRPRIATPLMAREDLWQKGAIRSGKDLKGRKVAVNVNGSIPEYLLTLVLQKYGMTLKDVDETTLSFPNQVIALKNGAIDAGFLPEPFASTAEREHIAAVVTPEEGVGAGDLTTMVFFGGKFLRERPAVAERFLRAMVRAAREVQGDYNKNPAIAQILAKGTGLKLEDIEASTSFSFDPNLDIAKYVDSLKRQEAIDIKNGRTNYSAPLDMSKVIDASFVHKADISLK